MRKPCCQLRVINRSSDVLLFILCHGKCFVKVNEICILEGGDTFFPLASATTYSHICHSSMHVTCGWKALLVDASLYFYPNFIMKHDIINCLLVTSVATHNRCVSVRRKIRINKVVEFPVSLWFWHSLKWRHLFF